MSVVQKFNSVLASITSGYAKAKSAVDYVTSFISDEPLDYGSLALGLGAGSLAGGRILLGLGALAVGYGLRNKTRIRTLLASLTA